jgi:hypothetical protein
MDAAATTIQRAYRAMIDRRRANPSGGALPQHSTVDQFTDGLMRAAADDMHREHQRALSYKYKYMLAIRKLNTLKKKHRATVASNKRMRRCLEAQTTRAVFNYLDRRRRQGKPYPGLAKVERYLMVDGAYILTTHRDWSDVQPCIHAIANAWLQEHGDTANDPIVL